jgi:hypothetical protein
MVGCAPRDTLRPVRAPAESDSAGTVWGDEYEGLAVDGGEQARSLPRGYNLEWTDGETQSARLDAFARGAGVHARSYPGGEVGSVSWRGEGTLRELVAGDFTPAIAEGALIGDPRTGGDLRASQTEHVQGLAMRSSTSPWSSMRGAGVVLRASAFRVSLGGWRAHDDAKSRAGVASIERIARGGMIGVAGGVSDAQRTAASIYGARETEGAFASGEIATSQTDVRAIARMVAGDRREWSAIAIAGAGPANNEPLVFARKERWGAALEHRDGWQWGASRVGVSTLTRRDVVSDIRRRRAFWDGEWRITGDTRLELAARVTREETTRPATGALASLPSRDVADDWRVRATWRVLLGLTDNSYRVEWVQNRTGKPGIVGTWSWRLRTGALDTKLSASAHALHSGQASYSTDAAPPGLIEYSSVTGKGASLAASVRLRLKRHAWVGAAWSQRPPGASRVWITLGLRG